MRWIMLVAAAVLIALGMVGVLVPGAGTWSAVVTAVLGLVLGALALLLAGREAPARPPDRPEAGAAPPPVPARSHALQLLAAFQQEARLVDFLKEPLDTYSDAQVGAAVRDVHRDGAALLERLFAIRPLRKEPEGADLVVPAGFDAGAMRLTGRVGGAPPYRGKLRHPGWQATKVELPRWTGSAEASRVVSPAEIEVQ